MKKNKFLAVAYGILPIATVSISPSSFAEEQLETIKHKQQLNIKVLQLFKKNSFEIIEI